MAIVRNFEVGLGQTLYDSIKNFMILCSELFRLLLNNVSEVGSLVVPRTCSHYADTGGIMCSNLTDCGDHGEAVHHSIQEAPGALPTVRRDAGLVRRQ